MGIWEHTAALRPGSGVPDRPWHHLKQFWDLKQAHWQLPLPPRGWGAGNRPASPRVSCCLGGWRRKITEEAPASSTGDPCPTLPCSHLEKPGAATSPKPAVCARHSSALLPPSLSTLLLTLSSPSSSSDVILQPSFCRRWFPAAGSNSSPSTSPE